MISVDKSVLFEHITATGECTPNRVRELTETLLEFEPAMESIVIAWLKGEDIAHRSFGEFSLDQIMTLRRDNRITNALLLLNEYVKNEAVGRMMILRGWMD